MNATGPEATAVNPTRHLPGEPGIWVFIIGDLMVFALFFCTFVFYRAQEAELFRASQSTLNGNFGALNTMLLLTSSWFVARAIQAVRDQLVRRAPMLFGAAFLCGCGFVLIKYLEYSEKIRAGITLTSNSFFMYYYIFTGIHLLHVLIGLGVLTWLWMRSRSRCTEISDITLMESGASYWHMVDVLWIVLFPLLYLMK